MSAFYHTKRVITSASATTEASGYPASNAALESIRRPWRSTSIVADQTWTGNMASAAAAAVLITDANFASCTVKNAADATIGTLTTYADKLTGRRRGLLVAAIGATTAIKLVIPAGTPTDGAAYFKVGAAYIFATAATMPRPPMDGTRVRAIYPKVSVELPNGQVAQAITGADVLSLSMPFKRESSEDGLELVRRARDAAVCLAIATTEYPELVLPLRCVASNLEESFSGYLAHDATVELREIT